MSPFKFNTKLFADTASISEMVELYQRPFIKGFTTNPTLMKKAGVLDYKDFAQAALQSVHDRPISFEVFSDDFKEMYAQALEISSWGKHVYVKIPVMNSKGESSEQLIRALSRKGVKLNVTALLTISQVRTIANALSQGPSAYISVFAGRIADTGRDPLPVMSAALEIMHPFPQLELIWASPRELLNIFQADQIGCHIITLTLDIIKKLHLIGKSCDEYSLETVQMFYHDAKKADLKLLTSEAEFV